MKRSEPGNTDSLNKVSKTPTIPKEGTIERRELVTVEHLEKSFGKDKIFEGFSFKIFESSFTTILGLNGTGKSTLLNILCGRMGSDKVNGNILGADFNTDFGETKSRIAMVAENINFDLGTNLAEFCDYYGQLYQGFDHKKFDELIYLRKLNLRKNFGQLSRGQKMQLCLVLALCQGAEIILIDEVTSVLDYKACQFFLDELESYREGGGTVVLTTNIIDEVQKYTTDLLIIKNFSELIWGSREEVLGQFQKCIVPSDQVIEGENVAFMGLGRAAEKIYLVPKGFRVKKGDAHFEDPSLHEVFNYLTRT